MVLILLVNLAPLGHHALVQPSSPPQSWLLKSVGHTFEVHHITFLAFQLKAFSLLTYSSSSSSSYRKALFMFTSLIYQYTSPESANIGHTVSNHTADCIFHSNLSPPIARNLCQSGALPCAHLSSNQTPNCSWSTSFLSKVHNVTFFILSKPLNFFLACRLSFTLQCFRQAHHIFPPLGGWDLHCWLT